MDIRKQLKESEVTKTSEELQKLGYVVDEVMSGVKGGNLFDLDHKEVRGERGGLLHDKFCVIDNVHTICGSYNWTLKAESKNDEDVAFHFEDYKFASTYTRRFNEIWRRNSNTEQE